MNNVIEHTQTQETVNTSVSILDHQSMSSMMQFAEVMAQGKFSVPKHLQNNIADCLAITMQSMQWGMNPFAVAQKTHLINGVLGYESQLVNAVISSSKAVKGRFKYEYSQGWEKLAGKVKIEKNTNNNWVPKKQWTHEDESKLWVKVGAVLNGDDFVTWGEPVYFSNVITRNSPLWVTAPAQQLSYLALKYWARLFTPDVILGVYDKESLEDSTPDITGRVEKDITPKSANDLNSMLSDTKKEVKHPSAPQNNTVQAETIDSNAVTPFDEITHAVRDIQNGDDYAAALAMFNKARDNGDCSNDELQTLFNSLNNAFKQFG